MRLSHYFEDLSSAYNAEIDDLVSDSEGKNVLAARLKEKRSQFAAMMSMIDFAPEMVAPAFHGGISFTNPHAMTLLSGTEPEEFPAWDEVKATVRFEPWAQDLIDTVLCEPDGERFMCTVVCLEFLHGHDSGKYAGKKAGADEDDAESEEREPGDNDGDLDDDERDLDEAGAGWMEEQGFDRRD